MKKVFGWFLLIIGVLIILWGIWSSYEIFTARRPAPEVFKIQQAEEVSLPQEKRQGGIQEEVQQQMQETLKEQFEKMMPPDFLPKLFNLISWSIFAAILFLGGGKLGTLGVQLLRSTKIIKK
jgi:hypothetical protein